jgi:hypothetical protein
MTALVTNFIMVTIVAIVAMAPNVTIDVTVSVTHVPVFTVVTFATLPTNATSVYWLLQFRESARSVAQCGHFLSCFFLLIDAVSCQDYACIASFTLVTNIALVATVTSVTMVTFLTTVTNIYWLLWLPLLPCFSLPRLLT